jgi:hypothetical protein
VPAVRGQSSPIAEVTQCTEGWHLSEEPERSERPHQDGELADDSTTEVEDSPAGQDEDAGTPQRRTRSTRSLDGMADLPQRPGEDRTVGTVFTAPVGTAYRPSMFVTLTLGSYGKVRPGHGLPARYNYRRAALDALHFANLMDHWFQNLRRPAGYRVPWSTSRSTPTSACWQTR